MLRFLSTTVSDATDCDRCGRVCDACCRADAILEQQWRQLALYGWRVA